MSIDNNKKFFSLEKDITNFFSNHPGEFFTVTELDSCLTSIPYDKLKSSLSSYNEEPADTTKYLKSLCNYMSKRRRLKHLRKKLNSSVEEDVFGLN